MRATCIPALFVILLLGLFSCSAPRYATYKPPGDAAPWKVKAVKTMTGWVVVTIDDKEVLKGQYPPFFGEREFTGTFEGRRVSMVLRERNEHGRTIWECLFFADYNQIGQWNW